MLTHTITIYHTVTSVWAERPAYYMNSECYSRSECYVAYIVRKEKACNKYVVIKLSSKRDDMYCVSVLIVGHMRGNNCMSREQRLILIS